MILRKTYPAPDLACFLRLLSHRDGPATGQAAARKPGIDNKRGSTMRHSIIARINYAPITAVLLSLACWLGFYAVYANFGQTGFELVQRHDLMLNLEGAVLVALHAMGLLLLLACGTAAVAVLIKSGTRRGARNQASEVNPTL